MAARIYTDKDADLRWLKGKTCAVIGFGAQGRAHALNLNDSGLKVIVGLYPASKSRLRARRSGLVVLGTAEAARRADIIFLALSDTEMPGIYAEQIAPHLRPGQTLLFAHGFAIHYRTIVPRKDVDVVMLAPKGHRSGGWSGVCGRTRHACALGDPSESQPACQADGTGLGKGNRVHPCRRAGYDFPGGNGDRSFWGTSGALPAHERADSRRF